MILKFERTSQPIEEWALDYGIPVPLIRSRLKRGWSVERAITEPMVARRGEKLSPDAMRDVEPLPHPVPVAPAPVARPLQALRPRVPTAHRIQPKSGPPARRLSHDGVSLTMAQWANRLGLSTAALHSRIASGWPIARALTEPMSEWAKNHRASLRRNREAREPGVP